MNNSFMPFLGLFVEKDTQMQFFTFKMAAISRGQGHLMSYMGKVPLTPSNVPANTPIVTPTAWVYSYNNH